MPVVSVMQCTTQIQDADSWQTSCLLCKWSTLGGMSVHSLTPILCPVGGKRPWAGHCCDQMDAWVQVQDSKYGHKEDLYQEHSSALNC